MTEQKIKISPQRAIANYCKGCTYDPLAGGTWREQVENCTIVRCELYSYRPITAATKAKNREDYLATLTAEERIEAGRIAQERSQIMKERMSKND